MNTIRRHLVLILTALGLTLLALAKRLAGPDRPGGSRPTVPARKVVELPRSEFRVYRRRPAPGRLEVIKMGLAILLGSISFAVKGV